MMELDFLKILTGQLKGGMTEPEVRNLAKSLKDKLDIPEEVYNEALAEALYIISVNLGVSYKLEKEKSIPWIEEYYKNLDYTRWDRYESYLYDLLKFPKNVVSGIRENLMKIIDLSGNPQANNFLKKGLIIGDVQSGKTANYVGLMNLAAEVGYKLIIVLTGTTNTLREQTQIRVEEGLGVSNLDCGVKQIKSSNVDFEDPIYLTTREKDFSKRSREALNANLRSIKTPFVIVTKKNSTALRNIYEWLKSNNKGVNDNKINSSLMLIDDEADFASINTKGDENPTAINRHIREILNLFTKSSYVGFTATPYANIFIDPKSNKEMEEQDLFPSDYIYILGESSDYVGVQSIFDEDPRYPNMLRTLNSKEVENCLDLKHNKEDSFACLSSSMKHAINVFFLANTIRDIRGDNTSHRSMLFNISRFINLHNQIKDEVSDYVHEVKRAIRFNGKMQYEYAIKNSLISGIEESFDKEYSGVIEDNLSFEDILPRMNDAIYKIRTVLVNSKSKELDYLANQSEGERVIIIGGFALSRGLTLEGLVVSYYYRNSVMYDSLLQMGRWFGYRKGYTDLCRIYMTEKVISDFKFIALATKELKEDLKDKSDKGQTPKEFGMRIRTGHAGLIITARNKMKNSQSIVTKVNFSKEIIETVRFSIDQEKYTNPNIKSIKNLIENNKDKIIDEIYQGRSDSKGLKGVAKEEIINFLNNYCTIQRAANFDQQLLIKWLKENDIQELEKWDVAFVTGSVEGDGFDYGYGIKGKRIKRKSFQLCTSDNCFGTSSARLGSPLDGRFGLSNEQIDYVKVQYQQSEKSIGQKEYYKREINRNPILLVYSVVPHVNDLNIITYPFLPLISIGIPELEEEKTKLVEYKVTQLYLELDIPETEDEEE